jgi:hypothetical protein
MNGHADLERLLVIVLLVVFILVGLRLLGVAL